MYPTPRCLAKAGPAFTTTCERTPSSRGHSANTRRAAKTTSRQPSRGAVPQTVISNNCDAHGVRNFKHNKQEPTLHPVNSSASSVLPFCPLSPCSSIHHTRHHGPAATLIRLPISNGVHPRIRPGDTHSVSAEGSRTAVALDASCVHRASPPSDAQAAPPRRRAKLDLHRVTPRDSLPLRPSPPRTYVLDDACTRVRVIDHRKSVVDAKCGASPRVYLRLS